MISTFASFVPFHALLTLQKDQHAQLSSVSRNQHENPLDHDARSTGSCKAPSADIRRLAMVNQSDRRLKYVAPHPAYPVSLIRVLQPKAFHNKNHDP
jgi:hypothetical protein